MRVAKWGNSLAVRIPKDVADALAIKEGDEIEITAKATQGLEILRTPTVEERLERIRQLAKPLPKGWKFDRDEANAR